MSTEKVSCDFCHTKHIGIFQNQGDGCASFVTKTGIQGFYGSTEYDGTILEWKDKIPEHIQRVMNYNEGKKPYIICDRCVNRLRDKKQVRIISKGAVW